MEILKHINWVDILMAVVAFRVIYSGVQSGFAAEFLNFLAALVAVFTSFHYYIALAGLVAKTAVPSPVLHTSAFVVLCVGTLLLCLLIKNGLFMLFTVQTQSALDKWGAAVAAVFRFFLAGSLILCGLLISENKYFERMIGASYSGPKIVRIAPQVYRTLCDGFVTRLFPEEKKNPAVSKAVDNIPRK